LQGTKYTYGPIMLFQNDLEVAPSLSPLPHPGLQYYRA
jgi:hypothetical protein